MRIVTWNCSMAMHRKLDRLVSLRPDIAVLPECASPATTSAKPVYSRATSHAWMGDRPTKGLAVLSFGDWRLTPLPIPGGARFILPLQVDGPLPFRLLAVWTQAPDYVEHTHAALTALGPGFFSVPTVIAGDLNSNSIWDANRVDNHSRLVERLRALGIVSAYHEHRGEAHGAETQPTFFLYKQRARPFHLDYVFVPQAWLRRVRAVDVGSLDAWRDASDHVPVSVTVAERRGRAASRR